MAALPPAETIRAKRDGAALTAAQIDDFVAGLVDGRWSEGQAAALAMAIVLRGMDAAEGVALTRAMTRSGAVLRWDDTGLPGPVVDKHSTGGVGDKVSLVLAPIVAACGGVVPMLSGRGLGHTGGTLDKLAALPGYTLTPPRAQLLAALRQAGCAIVGASDDLAPADRRLYAIRDVTATVESVPLITASILSKKLAAGVGHLVMDVKCGNGAFMQQPEAARTLARSLVRVAQGAGLPCRALITDMDCVLGHHAGNALEVAESLDFLTGRRQAPRLKALTLALAAQMLQMAGLAATPAEGEARAAAALAGGQAAEHFARMVAALGGPADVLTAPGLPLAPVQQVVAAHQAGWVQGMDTRALGLAVVALGGGRLRPQDGIDPRVGLADVLPPGTPVAAGQPLAVVHAADARSAEAAVQAVRAAIGLGEHPPPAARPVVLELLDG